MTKDLEQWIETRTLAFLWIAKDQNQVESDQYLAEFWIKSVFEELESRILASYKLKPPRNRERKIYPPKVGVHYFKLKDEWFENGRK